MCETQVVRLANVPRASVDALLARYGLTLVMHSANEDITGSFWGDSEAGIVGHTVYVRGDTPVHSFLHETCHTLCMTTERRKGLDRDAGGDDLEEAAVCYLQVILADQIEGVGRQRVMQDMDAWGYSFRLGTTRSWFKGDAEDASNWLIYNDLIECDGTPTFRLRV